MSKLTTHLAKHLREIHFGKNWTWSNLQDQTKDINWEEATAQVADLNTIAKLFYHIHYYVKVTIPVFEGGQLDASDKFSFDLPPIQSEEDWQALLKKAFEDAEKLAKLIEQLPEEKLWTIFVDEKYGNYYRNIQGIIEHSHYHLGQIVMVKKMLRNQEPSSD